MPFPTEHAARISAADKFNDVRRVNNKLGDGIHAIFGITDDNGGGNRSEIISIRFDKKKFTPAQARKWLKEHDFTAKVFEPAEEKKEKAGLIEIDLVIVKANIGEDGQTRWLATASDTDRDRTGERTSLTLFQNFISRIEKGTLVSFLAPPRKPFLGVSHYPDLEGFGEAGESDKLYIDGQKFKAGGVFYSDDGHPLGPVLFQAVSQEQQYIKRGGEVEQPIRISAAWWDLQHSHGDFIFTRRSLDDSCPMCQAGADSKTYLDGQLDHFATTRVPINPRTSLALEEKSMATTRKEDASTIVGDEWAEELERRAKLVGKSEAEAEPEGLVIKASSLGTFLRNRRKEMDMTVDDVAGKLPIEASTLTSIESGEIETPSKPVLAALAKALNVSVSRLEEMLPSGATPGEKVGTTGSEKKSETETPVVEKAKDKKGKRPAFLDAADEEDDEDEEEVEKGMDKDKKKKMKADFDLSHLTDEQRQKALIVLSEAGLIERMPDDEMAAMPVGPFGGAMSLDDAETFVATKEKMDAVSDNWGMFLGVVRNIMMGHPGDDENESDFVQRKLDLMSQAVEDLGDRIAALKAGLADAYLLHPVAAEVTEQAQDLISRSDIMSEEIRNQDHFDQLRSTVQTVLSNAELGRDQKAEAIQRALNEFVPVVRSQLDATNPPDVAKLVGEEVQKAFSPIQEQLALITAKLNAQPAPQPGQPQQKSMTVRGTATTGYTPDQVNKPSSIRDIARRSVGLPV